MSGKLTSQHRKNRLAANRARKRWFVEMLGGRCVECGIMGHPAIFDFNHIDPTTKEFCISTRISAPLPILLEELAKCELMCANCHRIRTAKY